MDRRRSHDLHGAERQVADGAHELLELARRMRALRMVIGVVRTRREFVHEQLSVAQHEHLHGEQPHDVQRLGDVTREELRALLEFVGDAGRRHGVREHASGVHVPRRRIHLGVTIDAARDEHADLECDVEERLDHADRRAEPRERLAALGGSAHAHLAAPVIAAHRALHDAGAKRGDGIGGGGGLTRRAELTEREVVSCEPLLLARALLHDDHGLDARMQRRFLRGGFE